MFIVFVTEHGETPTSRAIMRSRECHDLKQACDYARERVKNSDPARKRSASVTTKNGMNKFHAWFNDSEKYQEQAFV